MHVNLCVDFIYVVESRSDLKFVENMVPCKANLQILFRLQHRKQFRM